MRQHVKIKITDLSRLGRDSLHGNITYDGLILMNADHITCFNDVGDIYKVTLNELMFRLKNEPISKTRSDLSDDVVDITKDEITIGLEGMSRSMSKDFKRMSLWLCYQPWSPLAELYEVNLPDFYYHFRQSTVVDSLEQFAESHNKIIRILGYEQNHIEGRTFLSNEFYLDEKGDIWLYLSTGELSERELKRLEEDYREYLRDAEECYYEEHHG
jgi:hypothetical protein